MIVYWLGFAGGALLVGAAVYLSNADHRAKVAEWIKDLRH
jgi:hypothetical protein